MPAPSGGRLKSDGGMSILVDDRAMGRGSAVFVRAPGAGCERFCGDARIWQIAALSLLLAWNVTHLTIGASLVPSLVAVVSAIVAQVAAARLATLRSLDLRSPLITGLSLALLLRGERFVGARPSPPASRSPPSSSFASPASISSTLPLSPSSRC